MASRQENRISDKSGRLQPVDDIDFAEDEAAPVVNVPEPAPPSQQDIAMVLGPLLHRPGGLRDGSVYVLGLNAIRKFFGAKWSEVAAKVYEVMETVIAEEIAPNDLYTRVGGETYLLAFSRDSEAVAGAKAASIARRVKHKLFGRSSHLELEIHALGHRKGPPTASVERAPGVERPSFAMAEPLAAIGTPSDFVFMPIWDAYHKILSTYACLPVGTLRSGRKRVGHQLLAPDATDLDRAQFDKSTFEYTVTVAEELHRNHFAVIVTFPIDYASLGSLKSREMLLSAFHTVPKHLKSLITLQIANIPDDVVVSTLADRVAPLRPCFRSVSLQIGDLFQDVRRFAYMGIHGLTFGLGSWPTDRRMDFEHIATAIRHAKTARLYFGFGGVPDVDTAKKLVDAGATYLSGPFLGAGLEMPANMRRCTLEEIGRGNLLT
jgi:hypothetical protein